MTDATRRTIRTGLQAVLGLLAALPLLISTAGLPQTLPGIAVALTVSGAITRVMALDVVEQLLPAWLRATEGEPTE
ncbi:hypothetical protein [Kitasatospora sp. NPDC088351]|uniref:hypothetical protein n=1 Tax=Kitasatospora sp. NPDC088351 TaxID=3155180 RepID=UPI00342041CC